MFARWHHVHKFSSSGGGGGGRRRRVGGGSSIFSANKVGLSQ